jgi:hypothetical protein
MKSRVECGKRAGACFKGLVVTLLAALWAISIQSMQAQVNCINSPSLCAGLRVQNLSVYATMPDGDGNQRITTSFRVVNTGTLAAPSSSTILQSAPATTVIATPFLLSGATAFLTNTIVTASTDFIITATAANGNTASYHFSTASPVLGRWRPVGPSVILNADSSIEGVGRVATAAVDPTSTAIIYAGARASGLWKTFDGGASWQPLTDAFPTTNIQAVAVDSVNPAHVFIATPKGLFGSTNGGQAWSLLNGSNLGTIGGDTGTLLARSILIRLNPGTAPTMSNIYRSTGTLLPSPLLALPATIMYLATSNGLITSLTGGITWSGPVVGTGEIINSVDQDRNNSNHLLVSVVSQPSANGASPLAGVWETFNGGLTAGSWHQLQGCPDHPAPNFSPGYFSQKGQIWVTEASGTQWISDKDENQDHELWRTLPETCTVNGYPEHGWQLLSQGAATPCIGPNADPDGNNSEWSFLHADPANPAIVYKAGVNLCRSTDGGATFQKVDVGLHADQHVLAFHPLDPGSVFLGNDGGFYSSDDTGVVWSFAALGLSNTEFLDGDFGGASPQIVLGASQDNLLSYTDLTSPVWHAIDLGSDLDGDRTTVVVDPLNSAVQYTIGQAVDHFSRVVNGVRDNFSTSGLPSNCNTYTDYPPALFTNFIATNNPDWHLLATVGSASWNPAGKPCMGNGGLWTGPPWTPLFAPTDGQTLIRVAYDPSNGLFLAGGNGTTAGGSIYVNFSPDVMAAVWTAPAGAILAIVPDQRQPNKYLIATSVPSGTGRIFEISPAGILNFSGNDITGNLPAARILTVASNWYEPGVVYIGTQGQGVFRGSQNNLGRWIWQSLSNGLPPGTNVTKLHVDQLYGTIYATTLGRGVFVLDTVQIIIQ